MDHRRVGFPVGYQLRSVRAGRLFDRPVLLSIGVLLLALSLLELLLGMVAALLFIVPVEPLGVADELLGIVAEPLGIVVDEPLGAVVEPLGIVDEPLGMVVEPLGAEPMEPEPVPLWLGSVGFGVVSGVGVVVWLGTAGVGDASLGEVGVVVCAYARLMALTTATAAAVAMRDLDAFMFKLLREKVERLVAGRPGQCIA